MKNVILELVIGLTIFSALYAQGVAPADSDGDGKLEISSKDNLLYLSQNSNADWSANYEQTAPITFSSSDFQSDGDFYNSGAGFSPIGNSGTKFTGTYDGGGNTITNLFINRSGINYIGLFGYTNSGATITNIGVTNVDITGSYYVGGLVGYNDNSSTISNSYSTGSVSGYAAVGGLVGQNDGSTVSNSYSSGSVSSVGGGYVGGLVGFDISSTISNSYSTGSVSGDIAGGLVGYSQHSTISNSYSMGSVSGSVAGGLVGSRYLGTINNSFWNTVTSGQSTSAGGTGLTSSQMQNQVNFTNWDFTNVWAMSSSITFNNYPTLRWTGAYAEAPTNNQIVSLPNLVWIAENSTRWSGAYSQTADINAWKTRHWADGKGWTPIGYGSISFTGSYDGGGYTIDHLYINRSDIDFLGLFGYTSDATITSIGVTNVDITGNYYVGGLVGQNYNFSTISNSYSTGSVSGVIGGGLVGMNNFSTISNSYSMSSASVSGGYVGGLVGWNYISTVSNSYSTGSVTGSGTDVGGLVGKSYSSTVTNSFWDTQTSNQSSSAGGTRKTTTQMKTLATFTNTSTVGLTTAWDFVTNPNNDAANNDYWDIDLSGSVNGGYPYLSWQDGEDVSLPVELTSFTAECWSNAVLLKWSTESEIENLGFIIQKKIAVGANHDSPVSWSEIASYKNELSLEGHGSTTTQHEYKFADNQQVQPGMTYVYRLGDVDYSGGVTWHDPFEITVPVSDVTVPTEFGLQRAFPNPFNPSVTLRYNLNKDAETTLEIYNMRGQLIETLVNNYQLKGTYNVSWQPVNLSTGIYIVQLQSGNRTNLQKVVYVK